MGVKYVGQKAAAALDAQTRNREQVYDPLVSELADTLGSSDLIKGAEDTVNKGFSRADEMTARQLSRFGVTQSKAGEQTADQKRNLGQGIQKAEIMNNAIGSQYERNQEVRAKLSSVGRGVQSSANAGFVQGAEGETAVATAKANADAAASAQRSQRNTQVASMAIMAFMTM